MDRESSRSSFHTTDSVDPLKCTLAEMNEDDLKKERDVLLNKVPKLEVKEETLDIWDVEETGCTTGVSCGTTNDVAVSLLSDEERDAVDPLAPETMQDEQQMEEDFSNISTSTVDSLGLPCEKCDVTSFSPLYLNNHRKSCRRRKKPAVRVKPEKVTRGIESLAKMIGGKKMYCCQYCEYKTDGSDHIKTHLATHTGEKAFLCDECGKTCISASSFAIHKRIHSGDKPFKCDVCSYASISASNLKTHTMKHLADKTFACKLCEYKTHQSCHMTSHMRVHTGEKPYKCNHCRYKAAHKNSLKAHVQAKHTHNMPYSCEQCEYKATQRSHLQTHVRTKHTQDKPYSCVHCEFRTAVKSRLTNHMRGKHTKQSC